jgi:hypothetical protein
MINIYEELKEFMNNFDKFCKKTNMILINLLLLIKINYTLIYTNENNNTSIPYLSPEYRIIEKTALIPVILQFQEKRIKYFSINSSRTLLVLC